MSCTYPISLAQVLTASTCTSPVLARAKLTALPASIGYVFQNIASSRHVYKLLCNVGRSRLIKIGILYTFDIPTCLVC